MSNRSSSLFTIWLVIIIATCLTSCSLAGLLPFSADQPEAETQQLFPGIHYQRIVLQSPRPLVVHVVKIDLRQPGLSFLVTPGDPDSELPLNARTTSGFLDEFKVQLAINGDGFTPWWSRGILDYYPKEGDPVAPSGLAASRGQIYHQAETNTPVLYLSRTNKASFTAPGNKLYNALAGNQMLVERGKVVNDLEEGIEPRSAIGFDRRGRSLILLVVDGRQAGYSEGASLAELAKLLIEQGAYTAMNLDGGGSSTLVIEDPSGKPKLLNSPIDAQIPGRERPVGNHLGVLVKTDQ